MKIYNTMTRQKEEFKTIEPGKVRMYLCGPTVYNYIHVGNARSTVAFDTVRRYLEYKGYEVNYVSNFTDVDDRIINQAIEEGVSTKEIADKYIDAFTEDTGKLNVKPACVHPRVIDHIEEIIEFVEALIEKGFAYESQGDVYYRARKFKNYGQLSNKSLDELEVGASQRTGSEQDKKEDPLDFALWKAAKEGEVSWNSPWGAGRPGWHIECSVMVNKHLGTTIDIHAGGQDLEFPHHENEIAQSEAKTGKKFARYWLHNGFVTIGEEDQKMSKSLGNFVTVHDLLKEVNPQVIRFFMSTTQYRRPIRYSSANLNEAKVNLNKLQTAYENLSYRLKDSVEGNDKEVEANFANLEKDFVKVMDDDFNVQNGISVVYEMAKQLNVYSEKEKVYTDTINNLINIYKKVVEIFGISFNEEKELLDETIEQLIQERNEARKNKNFKRSDEIRDLLKEQGIILEDTAQGTRWKRND